MSVFSAYAQFYDALYQAKDYPAECDFLEQVFRRYAKTPVRSILELGCGTGGHTLPLAQRGYAITGIDRSSEMLSMARAKAAAASAQASEFCLADIRDFDLKRTFDTVIAVFAVLSYMTSNADFLAALKTARRHLRPGGLFFFDAWFGPAVLTDRPGDRYKIVEARDGDDERIIRFVHPELNIYQHTVDVNYKVLRQRGDRVIADVSETHTMRFFFPQEINFYLETAGFQVKNICQFMHLDTPLSDHEWNMAVVAEAV